MQMISLPMNQQRKGIYMFWEITDSVPVPATAGKRGRTAKYPFSEMEVGQSVFFEGARTGGKEYLAAQAAGRSKGWRFSGRAEGSGLRIWRVE